MAEDKYFKLEIVCPERVFYQGKASMVELNTREGEVGIYKNHIPLTTILEPGIVTITEGEQKKQAALHTGFMEILPDRVRIMAEAAEWPWEIDKNRALAAKERAEKRLAAKDSEVNLIRAETAFHKALIRIELADHV